MHLKCVHFQNLHIFVIIYKSFILNKQQSDVNNSCLFIYLIIYFIIYFCPSVAVVFPCINN